MNQILFEGIRCFHDRHSCSLKPITLLVGENSSGKTTFLALARIAWDIAIGDLGDDLFNEEPFMLGSYDQIASFRGGKAGRAKSFEIGSEVSLKFAQKSNVSELFANKAEIFARFCPKGSESKIDEWRFICGNFKLEAKQSTRNSGFEIIVTTPKGSQGVEESVHFHSWINMYRILQDLSFMLSRDFFDNKKRKVSHQSVVTDVELRELRSVSFELSRSIGQRPYAFAPIRTRPQRTYDPLKEVPKPEGSHVPMVLARIFLEDTKGSKDLKEALNSFGKASGLFNSVEVKRKGYKESDPFQIGVKTIGQAFNLVDVGYGVSQALPIVVDVLQNPQKSTFLLQQPEVHLHPKAQAELGSFLATLSKEQDKHFIIETHSDYLIDRLRMDIRDKKGLSPDDVAILYFEKSQGGVNVHKLILDEQGNLVDPPSTYRQFFLTEERRMFGA